MSFVLDSSVALAWLLPDERSEAVDPLLDRLAVGRVSVPCHWPLEVGNALISAVRNKRLAGNDLRRLLKHAAAFPVDIDSGDVDIAFNGVVQLAARHGLTTYDAAYVELAQRNRCPLATLDTRLATACKAAGVVVLP